MAVRLLPWLLFSIILSGCLQDAAIPVHVDGTSRFDINSYHAYTGQPDSLEGVWIAIHKGQLEESVDEVDFEVSGHIREIVDIRRVDDVYYLRTCREPDVNRVVSISGSSVSVTMNDDLATLTLEDTTLMTGNASHTSPDSSYSGTLAMKKVAALGKQFGNFGFYTADNQMISRTAHCFQEGALRVVGSRSFFSQWADVEMLTAASFGEAGSFQQTGYLVSRDGTADPVREFLFREGVAGVDATVRSFPQGNEAIQVSTQANTINNYQSSFSIDTVSSGEIDLAFEIGSLLGGLLPLEDDVVDFDETPDVTDWWDSGWDWDWHWDWLQSFWKYLPER